MKKIFLIFLIFSFFYKTSFAEWCNSSYLSKAEQCIKSQDKNRSIEDFVCIQASNEDVLFQVILDEEFKKIDTKMDEYLEALTNSKNQYAWKWAKLTYFDWINAIWDKSREFKDLYKDACKLSVIESWKCTENIWYTLPEEKSAISNYIAEKCLKWSNWDWYKLIDVKMEIFNSVAFNIMQLNKAQVSKDQKKLYDQEQRTKYNKLLDIMMINVWYIERIWQKWPSKIKNPL